MFDRLLCTPLGLQETKQQRLCEVKKLLPLYFIFQRNFLTSSFYLTSPLQQLLGNLKKRWCCSTINQDFKKLSRFILFFKIITPLYWVGRGVFRTLQNICDGAFYDVIFLKNSFIADVNTSLQLYAEQCNYIFLPQDFLSMYTAVNSHIQETCFIPLQVFFYHILS